MTDHLPRILLALAGLAGLIAFTLSGLAGLLGLLAPVPAVVCCCAVFLTGLVAAIMADGGAA